MALDLRNYSVRNNHTTPNGMDGSIILLTHKNPSRTVRFGGIFQFFMKKTALKYVLSFILVLNHLNQFF